MKALLESSMTVLLFARSSGRSAALWGILGWNARKSSVIGGASPNKVCCHKPGYSWTRRSAGHSSQSFPFQLRSFSGVWPLTGRRPSYLTKQATCCSRH
jgi:hypothetical protein